jgi:hypothetical protein
MKKLAAAALIAAITATGANAGGPGRVAPEPAPAAPAPGTGAGFGLGAAGILPVGAAVAAGVLIAVLAGTDDSATATTTAAD